MNTASGQSTLEILPDEILLEVCKYLLGADILQSFCGLNRRITQMITQYRYHVSLNKTYISTFNYLCVNILPQIGSQIRSLYLDCFYSVVQDQSFIHYFGNKMSIIFPRLERITLASYRHDRLVALLDTLHDLNHLVEIRLYSFFPVQLSDQPTFVRSLVQANNNRFKTILIDDNSSCLSFNDTDQYLNVLQLRIKLISIVDLPVLFVVFPNVHYLDVVIRGESDMFIHVNEMKTSPLLYVTDFRLQSIMHSWTFEELFVLLTQLPVVQHLSIFLFTHDKRLVEGYMVLPLLPSTVQKFNYAIDLFSATPLDQADEVLASWPSSHPIKCFFNNRFMFLHTLPWIFPRLGLSSSHNKMMSSCVNNTTDYDKNVEQLDLWIDRDFTLTKSLAGISQCRRVRQIVIDGENEGGAVKEEKLPISCLPRLSRLFEICLYGSIPSDLNHFSFILNAAPYLFRLHIPFDYLLKLIEDPQTSHLLGLRITSLNIDKTETNSSSITANKEHISIIASTFPRVLDLYMDLTQLPCSTNIVSNENVLKDSSESILLCLLTKFKEHRLVSLCVDGNFLEELKTNTEQWLRDNTILHEQQFKAVSCNNMNRLLIWL